ncbi:MAG: family 16 glycosylhydrolase [Kineosporiaceae bacterium]
MGTGGRVRRPRAPAALLVTTLLAATSLAGCGSSGPDGAGAPSVPSAGATQPGSPSGGATAQSWRLVWSDEFEGPAGTPPDPARWTHDTGDGGWGNDELQRYTDSTRNARLDGRGALEIVARVEQTGRSRRYTSARITTRRSFTPRYGRFEARLRLPGGRGIWPAFWLNGICATGWPDCGEVDVMESVDEVPRTVRSRIHGPGPSYRSGIGRDWRVRSRLDEGFHVYGVEWTPDHAAFTFDGVEYSRVERARLAAGEVWALDNDAYLILNVAVGGSWPGDPTPQTRFPTRLKVDWVRCYQR